VAENVLGTIFSRADALKRQLYDMIRNPSDYASMVGGRTQENMAAAQALQNEAFADPQNPLRITNPQALNQLTQMITSGPMGFAPAGITAFHGSPYLFRQFDPAKIGSGEGAQVYGVGAGYTAEARPVAEEYMRQVTAGTPQPPVRTFRGEELIPQTPEYMAARLLDADKMSLPKARKEVSSWIASAKPEMQREVANWQKTLDILNQAEKKSDFKNLGDRSYLYKGDIPDEILPKFLDWDKPLTKDVPQDVKDAFNKIIKDYPEVKDAFMKGFKENQPGWYYYSVLNDLAKTGDLAKNQQFASDVLERAGIRGIRYLDQGSRGEGKGTSNFIPFRAEDYKIQEINDIPIEDYIAKGLL